MAASIEREGLHGDADYVAEMSLKIGYDRHGNQHNLALLDAAARYLHADGQSVPLELELRRSQLEAQWLAGKLVRWLDTPAPDEPDGYAGRCAARYSHLLEQAHEPQDVVFVTAPMRNELRLLDGFFGALTEKPLKFPVAAVVIGDSLSSDGSVVRAMLKYGASIGRAAVRGIGPARQAAFDHLADPEIARTRVDPGHEYYLITDTDSIVTPGITDCYAEAFMREGNEQRLWATGRVEYSFLWPDRPYIAQDGSVVVPGDPTGELAGQFSPEQVEFVDLYTDPNELGRVTINDFASYQFFTGSKSIGQLFADLGEKQGDYIAGRRCRMLPGPNTCLRGSFLKMLGSLPDSFRYPMDGRHEQLHASIMWQSLLDFDAVGMHLGNDPQAVVRASERAIVGRYGYQWPFKGELPQSILSTNRLLEIWKGSGMAPYKVELGDKAIDAETTVALAIEGIKRYRAGEGRSC